MGLLIKTLVSCLVLQAIATTGKSGSTPKNVDFAIRIRNEMHGTNRTTVFYHCWSAEKDYGWHKSFPAAEFSWHFDVLPYGNGVKIHSCEFRSSEGSINIEIETMSTTAMLCDGHVCVYAVRSDGVYFLGYELYYPSHAFGRYFEMLRPVEKIIEPWKPWSPHQIRVLRHAVRRRRRRERDAYLKKLADDENIESRG
ncbi:PREDICTED: uncharacterized protein LOC104811241 [Tarenaya hassleriana]|uniref:uncharacterized protein LOC104811241 n=1 Tax=Tarenaya hassleriana TaxID=28532 RepID=UPI00053C7815|nr:PREDICTED: uncharacterized protein LOC104811241 [Tarenaya hassleriana]